MEVHGGKEAAVLVPVFEHDGLHAVFTRRRHDLRRHAGEISFPGGRRDAGEELVETALREAHEEVGLPPGAVHVVGALPPTPTFVTNYAIYPFVGVIEAGFAWGRAAHRGRRGARAAAGGAACRLRRAPAGAAPDPVPHADVRGGRPPDLGGDRPNPGRAAQPRSMTRSTALTGSPPGSMTSTGMCQRSAASRAIGSPSGNARS